MTETPAVEHLNANIRAEVARHKLTQMGLAELLGLSQASVSERMRGKTRWQLDELQRLAKAFDMPLAALIDDSGRKSVAS